MVEKILILNGPNLNLLGKRNVEIYGSVKFEDYLQLLRDAFPTLNISYFQSNSEGKLIDMLQDHGFAQNLGIVFNPAAYTHTSIAIADCVAAIEVPVVEVHISEISKREEFRHFSYIKEHCITQIMGEGLESYRRAIELLLSYEP